MCDGQTKQTKPIDVAAMRTLLEMTAGFPAGPWSWSVDKWKHNARLCTEEQWQSGEGWMLQLDKRVINAKLASVIESAPDLHAALAEALNEIDRLTRVYGQRTADDARYRPEPGDQFVYHSGPRTCEIVLRVENGRVWARAQYNSPPEDIDSDEPISEWAARPGAGVWVAKPTSKASE